ncbi:MAG: hypothetical protein EHM58_14860 [Ignavibacteriae bacterium]|nr:MAG: hypothetical protein EHM58_14860 [Ignavibacteriota bacterium]
MMRIINKYIILTLVIFSISLFSCKEETTVNNSGNPEPPLSNPYSSIHFTFYYTSYDSLSIKTTADSVERNYSRILSDLQTDTVLKTSVHFYKTYEELAAVVRHVVPNLPTWAIGLSTAKDTIHMLSPKHSEQNYEYMLIVLIHEFTHCVSLNINPAIANNPRWLWESAALYEAGQFVHPSQLPYMVNQNPPTLSQMNSISNTQIYEVGYLLSEYIVENWSRTHLKNMILSNGNISQVLEMTVSEFQTAWFQFVKTKYNI